MPRVHPDDESSILSVLTTERDELVRESNRIRSQIHHLLLQVDPEYKGQIGRLVTRRSLGALSRYAAPDEGALQEHRAAAVRRLAVRLELVKHHIDDVSLQIKDLAAARFPALMRLCGVNALTAGVLAGLLGPGQRFANDAQLAAYAGVAPLEASSGMRVRHRLSRSGNRRLNSVIYWIVLTQAHHSPEARAYLARRMSQGKTRREAHRALRRYIARALWRLWVECHSPSVVDARAGGRVMRQRRHEKRTATRRPWPALLTLTERLSPRSSFFKHRLHIGASHVVGDGHASRSPRRRRGPRIGGLSLTIGA